jgi:predicted flavoprotein YhiN
MNRHVIVVGAGAAGLTAALRAAEGGAHVTLLNAHPKIGLKILMSGGTRCNVTHREVTERDFNGGSRMFVRNVLRAFPPEKAREWIESLGVPLKLEETGKYFPVSDNAGSVLEALVGANERAGVEVVSGARVVRLVAEPRTDASETAAAGQDRRRFRVGIQRVADSAAFSSEVRGHGGESWSLPEAEPSEWRDADAVVLATGGLSFPRTGSDGVGYALAQSLGHTIVPPIPALTPLTADDPLCAEAQGVTLEVELSLWVDGGRVVTVPGSFLFAHFGYSGPAALDLSRHWLRATGDRRVTASFVPGVRSDSLVETWRARGVEDPRVTVRRFLSEFLVDRVVVALCSEAGVDPGALLGQVTRDRRSALVARVLERPMPVTGTLGYEKAEVTAGGLALEDVDARTLESRVVRGLYLCGEILDVEGRLGGFNFQWGWSSGTVAGRACAIGT